MKRKQNCQIDLIILILLIAGSLCFIDWDKKQDRYYNNLPKTISKAQIELPYEPIPAPEPDEVRFTSYYTGDYSNSGTVTASGLSVEDFEVNEYGWYTFDGKVVLAAATYTCLNSNSGACAAYNDLPAGYNIHALGEEVTFYIGDQSFTGIIADTCGASFWEEDHQRYDIFVAGSEWVTDQIGYIEMRGR